MSPKISLRLVLALASFTVQGIASSVLAQPQLAPQFDPTLINQSQLESIDATAKTVSLRGAKLAPNTTPVQLPNGGVRMQLVPGDLETVPLTVNAIAARRQHAVEVEEVSVGDMVSLLGQKAPNSAVKLVPPLLGHMGEIRYSSKADFFKVVSLQPLVLRRGEETTGGEEIVNLPFTNGPGTPPIGLMTVTRNSATTSLDFTITITITDTKNVDFDKWIELKLSDVAADFAEHKIQVQPEFETTPQGQKQVKRLIVTDTR